MGKLSAGDDPIVIDLPPLSLGRCHPLTRLVNGAIIVGRINKITREPMLATPARDSRGAGPRGCREQHIAQKGSLRALPSRPRIDGVREGRNQIGPYASAGMTPALCSSLGRKARTG